jgi:SAM-dependent methyltransferase
MLQAGNDSSWPTGRRRRQQRLRQAGRILLGGAGRQAFLDNGWVGPILDKLPAKTRQPVILRLLGISPHYFIYQDSNRFGSDVSRSVILREEMERNRTSRRQIVDVVLMPHISKDMRVLDFGCGPGFLAKELAPLVKHVVATDVSRGVLECAKNLNAAPNITYVRNGQSDLDCVERDSVDLVVSFAVFQHLAPEQALLFLKEIVRVLRPGGSAICQFAVQTGNPDVVDVAPEYPSPGLVSQARHRYELRYRTYSVSELDGLLDEAQITNYRLEGIADDGQLVDDLARQHIVLFSSLASEGTRGVS